MHSKKLFRSSNQTVLKNAERIYGGVLPQGNGLPHLICRPCERRVNNATQFRNTITETQQLLQKDVRTKRCIDISPSVTKPSTKAHAAGPSRRSLDFNVVDDHTYIHTYKTLFKHGKSSVLIIYKLYIKNVLPDTVLPDCRVGVTSIIIQIMF